MSTLFNRNPFVRLPTHSMAYALRHQMQLLSDITAITWLWNQLDLI